MLNWDSSIKVLSSIATLAYSRKDGLVSFHLASGHPTVSGDAEGFLVFARGRATVILVITSEGVRSLKKSLGK